MKKLLISSLVGVVVSVSSAMAEDFIMVKNLNVQFKNASTQYNDDNEQKHIVEFASFMKRTGLYALIEGYTSSKVKEGHTSSQVSSLYNYKLSIKRANKVLFELQKLGVAKNHIRSMGFGASSSLYDNSTKEGALKNRRVTAEVFNTAIELNEYIKSEKNRLKKIVLHKQ